MSKELIKFKNMSINNEIVKTVSAQELYKGLELEMANWARWCNNNIIKNEYFIENRDWVTFITVMRGNKVIDYLITVNFAQHLAMQTKSKIGHLYREYLINCEKRLKIRDNLKLEFPLMSKALEQMRKDLGKETKHYHYSTENDLLYLIVLGKRSRDLEIENIRDMLTLEQMQAIEHLQRLNTSMLEIGLEYQERKDKLTKIFETKYQPKLH